MESFDYQHINGKIVKDGDAQISPKDLGFLRSFAIFDYFNLREGVPVFLDDHIRRFFSSARHIGLPVNYTESEIKNFIFEFISVNTVKNGGIRLHLTGGEIDPVTRNHNTNFLIQGAFLPKFDKHKYENGVSLITFNYQREFPEVKTTNYLTWKWLEPKINEAGAVDVLYYFNDLITETSRGNFFIVDEDGTVITPRNHILEGITRKKIIKLARKNFRLKIRDVAIEELKNAKEAFITSSSKGVLPIVKIDDYLIYQGKTGRITRELGQLLDKEIRKDITHFQESII